MMRFRQALAASFMLSTVLTTAVPGIAFAEGVVLLQLGSFESREEATAKWSELQGKYPKLLEGLSVQIADVTLPPDNFTVYRTQAGVLDDRSNADIICSKLTAEGDECYVVESAMFEPAAPAPAAVAAAPAEDPAVVPEVGTPMPEMTDMPTQEAEAEMAAMEAEMAEAAQTEPQADMPAPVAEATPPQVDAPVIEPEAEPQAENALKPEMAAEAAPSESPQTLAEPNLAEQEMAAATANAAPPAESTPAPVAAEPAPSLLPDIDAPGVLLEKPTSAAPVIEEQAQAAPAPKPVEPPRVLRSSQFSPIGNAPVATMEPPVVAQSAAPANAYPTTDLPAGLPFQVKRNGQPVNVEPSQFIAGSDGVSVAEAVPVPLTDNVQRQSPMPYPVQELRKLGLPSAKPESYHVWAHLSAFETQQQALAFWDQFRRTHPGFPPVRVRVTHPYQLASYEKPRIALQVGPFNERWMVKDVCDAVRAAKLTCRLNREMGRSISARSSQSRYAAPMRASQRIAPLGAGAVNPQLARAAATPRGMYWVQFGAYGSEGEALSEWAMLQSRHGNDLKGMDPTVATAKRSSGAAGAYRLRTGPYLMRPQADIACSQLQPMGTRCVTIFE